MTSIHVGVVIRGTQKCLAPRLHNGGHPLETILLAANAAILPLLSLPIDELSHTFGFGNILDIYFYIALTHL